MASSGRVEPGDGGRAGMCITRVQARTDTLILDVHVPGAAIGAVTSAVVQINPRLPLHTLPVDLLAVLGWDWSLLRARQQGWVASLRLRGAPTARGRDAERQLRAAAAHLAQTLAEPPGRFHERQCGERWAVMARHALPALACTMMAALAMVAEPLRALSSTPLPLVLIGVPTALLLMYFMRSEGPQLALPQWPRALSAATWLARR